uniref:Uncharacterized protein n=1 Tax=viral metagenome TaxID=1070528 RepID=A0A6C0DP58_9ZZZZ
MELAALLVLGGAGYLLTQTTAPKTKKEPFANVASRPTSNVQTSMRATNPELDLQYNTMIDETPLTTVNSSKEASDRSYIQGGRTKTPPTAQVIQQYLPSQGSIFNVAPTIMMNPAGVELQPDYLDASTYTSPLSGETMESSDFTHNNMQPFFGSRVKQNVGCDTNVQRLDMFTGAGSTQIAKKEVEQMFDTTQVPFGNVYGLENSSDFVQGRINDPRNRGGERPFEPVMVAPGIGEGFSSTGKGGFQQFEVNDYMIKNIRRTDDLRVATNPKLTYEMPVVPGQQFVGKSMEDSGEVRKYRPDTFYIDKTGERFGVAGQGEYTKESTRPIQVMPETTRAETSVSYKGPGASQDFGLNYVVGSYRAPMKQHYGSAGYRNSDGTQYSSNPADDYGASSIEIRPNERYFTTDHQVGLNLSPAEAGAVTTHFIDESRPTRRGETIGNIRQSGVATGYANSAPAITVWDPNDIARTTVREGLVDLDRFGVAAPADAPARIQVYDPDDIARPTQKAQISAKSAYTGGPKASHERFMSHTFANNMRLNPGKQQIAKGRMPMGGNIAIFQGDEPNVTSRKLDDDVINDRAFAVNKVVDSGPGVADIGRVKYRTPLVLDVSKKQNQREIVDAVVNNPLMQSLQKNAEHDEQLLKQLQQTNPELFDY